MFTATKRRSLRSCASSLLHCLVDGERDRASTRSARVLLAGRAPVLRMERRSVGDTCRTRPGSPPIASPPCRRASLQEGDHAVGQRKRHAGIVPAAESISRLPPGPDGSRQVVHTGSATRRSSDRTGPPRRVPPRMEHGRYGDGRPALPRRDIGCGFALDPRRGGRTSRGRALTGRQRRDRRSHRRPDVSAASRSPGSTTAAAGPRSNAPGPAPASDRAPTRAGRATVEFVSVAARDRAGTGVHRCASRWPTTTPGTR